MKTKNTFGLLISLCVTLSSCSWQEYFVVKNSSSKTIVITYQLQKPNQNGFPIFHVKPESYGLSEKGKIDYNYKLVVSDSDTSLYSVKTVLKPNTALVFGNLSNDNYMEKNQYFINGRIFNFSMMEIEIDGEIIRITKATFDNYFTNKDGEISCQVK